MVIHILQKEIGKISQNHFPKLERNGGDGLIGGRSTDLCFIKKKPTSKTKTCPLFAWIMPRSVEMSAAQTTLVASR